MLIKNTNSITRKGGVNTMDIDEFTSKLEFVKEVSAKRGNARSFIAKCPSHNDSSPSLCVDLSSKGNILIKCWAGCGSLEVAESLGVAPHELFPEDDGYVQQGRRIRQTPDYHALRLSIADGARKKGEKQNKADLNSELESFLAIRNRGK